MIFLINNYIFDKIKKNMENNVIEVIDVKSLKKIIKSWDLSNFSIQTDEGFIKLEKLHETIEYQVYELILSDGKQLKCADNHIVFNDTMKEVFVKDLKPGDSILVRNDYDKLVKSTVVSVTDLGYKEPMYDFELIDDSKHRYYTNDILSHNTAIVEGLAMLIKDGKAPRVLLDKRIYSLDLAAMVAGTKYRGQFEERMKAILEELRDNKDIVLFIDEIHTIVGAGNANGSMDAANIFKPALARGEIQVIGATTLDEYRENIEKDGALTRRFQQVIVDEPSLEETIIILNNIKEKYEDHHKVTYTQEAIEECVKLSDRYIMDRCMPDKAIDVLDEVGASTNINHEMPEEIKTLEARKEAIKKAKLDVVKNQKYEQAAKLRDEEKKVISKLETAKQKWVDSIDKKRTVIDVDLVAEVVSMMSGVPLNKISAQETKRLMTMGDELNGKVIGQDNAVDKVVRAIKRNRLGIKDKSKPIASFIFLGASGVGKCYVADTEIVIRNKVTGLEEVTDINNFIKKIKR